MEMIWNPVKEKLPQKGGQYLITQMGTTKAKQKNQEPVVQEMTYLCNNDGTGGAFLSNHVLAWMQKPEPYIPSAEEKLNAEGGSPPFKTKAEIKEMEKKIFWSPFENMMQHNGKHFIILRELSEEEGDREGGCIEFEIRFDDSIEALARLEELNGDYLSGRASYNGSITPEEEFAVCELYPPWEAGTKCFVIISKGVGGGAEDIRYLLYAKNMNEALGCFMVEENNITFYEITEYLEI